jgi:hypothetical protein
MWTTFKRNNVEASDFNLAVWQLPAEKMFGFRRLFLKLLANRHDYHDIAGLGFRPAVYGLAMGIPRRNTNKLMRDIAAKLLQRLSRLCTVRP